MEHPSDDLLELYSMRRLTDADTARLEEHLLICEECRERLLLTDFDIAASREALKRLQEKGEE